MENIFGTPILQTSTGTRHGLFLLDSLSQTFWKDFENYILCNTTHAIITDGKILSVILNVNIKMYGLLLTFFNLQGKFHIPEAKFLNSTPSFKLFLMEINVILTFLNL